MVKHLLFTLLLVAPLCLRAQTDSPSGAKIPIVPLGKIVSASSDTLGTQLVVRATSNGNVLVNDISRRRVLLFDSSLTRVTPVIDSATGGATIQWGAQLIPYRGDSTLFVDLATRVLLVLDQTGKLARTMALPKPQDARLIAATSYGNPAIDPKGRLIYRAAYPIVQGKPNPATPWLMPVPFQSDSGPIVRADFDTRKVDTIATIRITQPEAMTMSQEPSGNVVMTVTLNPLDVGDEWAMLEDGTIGIVRVHDYHIDWIDANGMRRSSARMPFDWKRVSEQQKQTLLDSLRQIMQKQIAQIPMRKVQTPDGERDMRTDFELIPTSRLPDYENPIGPGAVKADHKGNLWIVPHTSLSARGGVLYDVVNKRGEIFKRVQFPAGYALIGFGNGDDVYVMRVAGKNGFVEKAFAN